MAGENPMTLPDPVIVLGAGAAVALVATLVALLHQRHLVGAEKKLLFGIIAVAILVPTLYTAGWTINHNLVSVTGGPIHWHADYQVFVCGERQDLIDPRFPSNKIGTPLFHEHDDDRIHVEGTVSDLRDIDLGSYFQVIGGRLTSTTLVYPTAEGVREVGSGNLCSGVPAELAVYVNGERITDPASYLYFPHPYVPPGDCIIIAFEPSPGQTTDRVCETWAAEGWTYDNYRELRAEYRVPEYFTHRPGGVE